MPAWIPEQALAAEQLIQARSASLTGGWVPVAVQLIALAALCYAIGWRTRPWRVLWLPVSVSVGVAAALATGGVLTLLGIAGEPPPWGLWPWIALSGFAVSIALAG